MQIVIAGGPDLAQRCFQLGGAVKRRARTEREGCHPVQGYRVQSTISIPSAGICQPARSATFRSWEAGRRAGLELLLCRNIFVALSRPGRRSISPRLPALAILLLL